MEAIKQNINYLGANSYPAILHESITALENAKADTIVGADMLKDVLSKTSKTLAPMLAISEFLTNAEAISKDDVTVAEIITFMKKQFKGGDLNFMMNLAKEEHFSKLTRTGFPSPQETIKAFAGAFNKKSSEIEKLIQDGIFDTLESSIYNEIKGQYVDLKKSTNKLVDEPIFANYVGLNESNATFNKNNIAKYTPIGLQYEDTENNRILLLTENDVLSFDVETKMIDRVTENVAIPNGQRRMMSAISELVYDFDKEFFAPSQRWDFNISVDKNGEVMLQDPRKGYEANTRKMEKSDLREFLSQSIDYYESMLVKPTKYNKELYMRDADNLVLLAENHNQLVKIDSLMVLKNLNESTYVMMNADISQTPKMIAGSDVYATQTYDSYSELQATIEMKLQSSLDGVFENQIAIERDFTSNKYQTIQDLTEDNEELESMLSDVLKMKKIAEPDSKSFEILFEQEKDLTAKLEANIVSLTGYKLHHSLYN